MDSPEDISRYYKKQYRIYDATRSFFLFGRKELTSRVNKNSNGRTLEVGCGTGYLLNKIIGVDKYGIDLSYEMLSVAKNKLATNVSLEQTTFLDYNPENKFDNIVFAYFFTISFGELETHIAKAKSLLNSGGRIYVVDFYDYGNQLYKKYMNWHGIEMNPSLLSQLENNFTTEHSELHSAYFGLWKYFIYQGVIS